MIDINTLSMAELVNLYNQQTGKEATVKTFNSKGLLLEKLRALRMKAHDNVKALMGKTVENGATEQEEMSAYAKVQELLKKYQLNPANYPLPTPVKARSDQRKAAKAAKAAKTEAPKTEAPKTEAKKSGRIIRVACEELLLKVDFIQDGKPYGLSYTDILEKIKEEFPNGKTSLACLRWYAVQLRERNEKVPNRPRARKAAA